MNNAYFNRAIKWFLLLFGSESFFCCSWNVELSGCSLQKMVPKCTEQENFPRTNNQINIERSTGGWIAFTYIQMITGGATSRTFFRATTLFVSLLVDCHFRSVWVAAGATAGKPVMILAYFASIRHRSLLFSPRLGNFVFRPNDQQSWRRRRWENFVCLFVPPVDKVDNKY